MQNQVEARIGGVWIIVKVLNVDRHFQCGPRANVIHVDQTHPSIPRVEREAPIALVVEKLGKIRSGARFVHYSTIMQHMLQSMIGSLYRLSVFVSFKISVVATLGDDFVQRRVFHLGQPEVVEVAERDGGKQHFVLVLDGGRRAERVVQVVFRAFVQFLDQQAESYYNQQ